MKKFVKKVQLKLGLLRVNTIQDPVWDSLQENFFEPMGWSESQKVKSSIGRDGHPIPWFTYPSIFFLEGRLHKDLNVFEYGSGNSTLWFQSRVASVVSIEHDEEWFEIVEKKLKNLSNVKYHLKDLSSGAYSSVILDFENEFDVVVIDGRDRINCAKNALEALKETGVIIWDNSDRIEYQEGYDFLINNNFRRLDFQGLGPINSYDWCTSVFYRDNNCFNL